MVPWENPSLRPKRHIDRSSRFCTAHCSVSHYKPVLSRWVYRLGGWEFTGDPRTVTDSSSLIPGHTFSLSLSSRTGFSGLQSRVPARRRTACRKWNVRRSQLSAVTPQAPPTERRPSHLYSCTTHTGQCNIMTQRTLEVNITSHHRKKTTGKLRFAL